VGIVPVFSAFTGWGNNKAESKELADLFALSAMHHFAASPVPATDFTPLSTEAQDRDPHDRHCHADVRSVTDSSASSLSEDDETMMAMLTDDGDEDGDEFDALLSRICLVQTELMDATAPPSEITTRASPVPSSSLSSCRSRRRTIKPIETKRSRKYQTEQWTERFDDLLAFRDRYGHMFVPHSYPENRKLAQWVKRQRYQHKLKSLGQHCTLSDDRERILADAGFIWDSHAASWQEQFQLLEQFAARNGHCNVPTRFEGSTTLNVWCKQQRKQYKLLCCGRPSSMTEERRECLESIGFNWSPRGV
jgi:hypothetical protein